MKKRSEKAALWSALVFPGAGHMLLKMYARGALLLATTVVALGYIVHSLFARGLVDQVNDMVYKSLSGELTPDLGTTMKLIDIGPDPIGVELASWLIVACWLYGIFDSYRQGARQDLGAT